MASTPVDVKEYPNSYVFVIDVPGLKSSDINVHVEDYNVLVISGERNRKEEKEGAKYLRMETMVGKFMHKFVLPENANTAVVSAVCQDGVLSVTVETLPPPQPKKLKTIEVSLDAIEKYTSLEVEHIYAQKERDKAIEKLREFEQKCSHLERNVTRLWEKLLSLEKGNHLLLQEASSARGSFSEKYSAPIASHTERRPIFENYKFLSRCIKENLGFKNGKPIAACIIYKCLHQWHAFESDNTAIFNYIIEHINGVLKVWKEGIVWPYWLSNTSALLRLLRSDGYDKGMSHVETIYPVLLFKQLLTACVEKNFGFLRDNLKKELAQLLQSCIQTAKTVRVRGGKSSGILWTGIVKLLDSFMIKLRGNHVPSFFIRKLVIQVFSFINVTLFNSLLLHRECCTFSNGKYLESGLAELDKWIANAKELVTHQKEKKSLEEIRVLCPALTVTQIYQISTMYWDDKFGTQNVFNEAVSIMKAIEMVNDSTNMTSKSFLLEDDQRIPFSAEDVDMAFPPIDLDDIYIPLFV